MIALVMPPQKRQRARTSGKGAAKRVPSRKAAVRPAKAKATKRAAKKQSHRVGPRHAAKPGNRSANEQLPKVTLPGDLYEQAGEWWWRTQLPGEDKAKARPLKTVGEGETACDRDTAERIAVEMWGQAATQFGARQITLDCTQKVERLKAQFLDKVRQLTEIVESANAKAQAEATARAEIEARLNAMIQTAERQATTPSMQVQPPAALGAMEPAASLDATKHIDSPQASGDARPTKSDISTACAAQPVPESPAIEDHDLTPQTGVCECCGAPDVPVSDLEAIDSGQLLCPDCIQALHIDISRIEAKTLSSSRA